MAASFHADLNKFPALDVARAKAWPKVELHLHLDGSLSTEFIAKRAAIRSEVCLTLVFNISQQISMTTFLSGVFSSPRPLSGSGPG